MKSYKNSLYLAVLFVFGFAATSFAQYDDLYYNPDTDSDYYTTSSSSDNYDDYDEYDEYDDYDEYEYEDDYDYYYSSRIRRFNRPYRGFGFYDPVYVDAYSYGSYDPYYDPFFSRPTTVGVATISTLITFTILEDMDIAATIATTMHTVHRHTGVVVQSQVAM